MKINESKNPKKNERFLAHRLRLTSRQAAIEHEAIALRAELRVSDFECLPIERAAATLPNGEVLALKNVPGITMEHMRYAREEGYSTVGAFAARIGGMLKVVFNCAHPPERICVNIMEEIWHVRLGHRPDIVSLVAINGRHRTYDAAIEDEAYGCGIATLVPLAALYAMVTQQVHIRRIAERFFVPIEVVEERIAATNLGELMNAQFQQFALLPPAV